MARTWGSDAVKAIWYSATITGILGGVTSVEDLRDFSAIAGQRDDLSWQGSTGRGGGVFGCGAGRSYSESTHQVKHTAAIGTRYDSAESASVQIFLADLQWGEVLRMFDRRVLAGAHDPDSVAEYQRMLATMRQRGYAINDGRTSAEEVGLAARVRDHRGETVAAVLLSAPRFRISTQMLEPLARTVADAGQEVAERLGYRSQLPVDGPKTGTDRSSAVC